MGETRNAYRILVSKPEGRLRVDDDNIKMNTVRSHLMQFEIVGYNNY